MDGKPQLEEKNAKDKSLRSDQPIRSSEEDLLTRVHLADAIGECILATRKPESIVIAINAPWGAGKSSFLNLLEQRLKSPKKDEVEPIFIWLNPWLYNSVEQLIEMSFDEFKRQVGSDKRVGQEIVDNLYQLAGQLQKTGSAFSEPWSVAIGSGIEFFAELFKNRRELPQLKDEINKRLEQLKRRVIVFIDDIDRLERDNLRLLFRAIRLCADFKKVTYVLAFDKSTVENHLTENDHISERDHSGRDYLEKIVQVSFDLPDPNPKELAHSWFKEIKDVLRSLPTRPVDEDRLRSVFHSSGFKDHFRTIRQIRRYANGLRLTLAPVAAEVNPVDFVGIDFLRTFCPKIYSEIAQRKDMLAPAPAIEDTQRVEQVRQWMEELCSEISPPNLKEPVQTLLSALFLDGVYTGSASLNQSTEDAAFEACRVCSPAFFNRYFRLATPSSQISKAEMDMFIQELEYKDATFQTLKRVISDGKVKGFCDRLESAINKPLPEKDLASLAKAIFRCVDNPDIQEKHASGYCVDSEFMSIIRHTLLRLKSEDKRYGLIITLIQENPTPYAQKSSAPYAVVKLVSFLRKLKDQGVFPIRDDYWNTIQERTAERIRLANSDGSLWAISGFKRHDILVEWAELTSEDKVCLAIISWLDREDDEKFIAFLEDFQQCLDRFSDSPRFKKLSTNSKIRERLMKISESNKEYAAGAIKLSRHLG